MFTLKTRNAAAGNGLIIAAFMLICAIFCLVFFDTFINKVVKPRVTDALNKGYPAYSISIGHLQYSLIRNQFDIDSVALNSVDGAFKAMVSRLSLSGLDRLYLFTGGRRGLAGLTGAKLDAKGLRIGFDRSSYAFLCKRLRASFPDSSLEADSINVHPASGDEKFFEGSEFRRTRCELIIPQCKVLGLAFHELLQGKGYRTREIRIRGPVFDILVNKEKPAAAEASPPPMPNEALSEIKVNLKIGTLNITDGRLTYGERFAVRAQPAFVTFEDMMVSAEGIANRGDRSSRIIIHGQAKFMDAGTMKVLMEIPATSREFSIHYSGSLSGMNLDALNSYLEPGEQIRIKTGTLQSATYDISIVSGCARGTLRAIYENLNFAVINKNTGSEKGLTNRITSFIANNFKIRTGNMPDKSGSLEIGKVNFLRKRDTTFLQLLWFSIRSGIKDVVGF
ncbi:MAG: hypothetical protein ABSE00_06605 [Chitinispirillaceae bacterium]